MAPRKYDLGKRAQAVAETRRRIVDATFELHNEKGVVATSMQDVAERADVALRTVYYHYPTVDDLVAGCGAKVMALLAPPAPDLLSGLGTFEERMRRLVHELFAMYGRAATQLEVARCEQREVPALAGFLAAEAAARDALVREALRPFRTGGAHVRQVMALTDFYVWKALTQQKVTTRQAVDIICRSLASVVGPGTAGKRGAAP